MAHEFHADGPGRDGHFLGLEPRFTEVDKSKFVVLPAPFELTTSYQSGTAKGPEAIIEASRYLEVYDIESQSEAYQHGIHTAQPLDCSNFDNFYADSINRISMYLQNNQVVCTLGGEHSISKPLIEAHCKHYGDLSVLQLDAHTDLRDQYEGNPNSHACVMARSLELEEVKSIVAVGIRSMDRSEVAKSDRSHIHFAHKIYGDESWMQAAIDKLQPKVYLTYDVDVLCPGIMPSTGTPEPGGLDWWTVDRFLRRVASQREIVGFDVVELSPMGNPAPDFLVAKAVYSLFSMIAKNSS